MLARCTLSDLASSPSSHLRNRLQAAAQSSRAACKAASSYKAKQLNTTALASTPELQEPPMATHTRSEIAKSVESTRADPRGQAGAAPPD